MNKTNATSKTNARNSSKTNVRLNSNDAKSNNCNCNSCDCKSYDSNAR